MKKSLAELLREVEQSIDEDAREEDDQPNPTQGANE